MAKIRKAIAGLAVLFSVIMLMPVIAQAANPGQAANSGWIVLLPVIMVQADDPGQAGDPGWIVSCNYSHSLSDDPIVFPGQPGASHLHDFIVLLPPRRCQFWDRAPDDS